MNASPFMNSLNNDNANESQEVIETRSETAIEPLFNEAFIRIFGQDRSRTITRSLINSILEKVDVEPIEDIEEISAEHASPQGSFECKTPRFDIQVVSESRYIELEAQRYPSAVGNRSIYYAANALTAATAKATRYKELSQAIVITLLDDPSPFPESKGLVQVCKWCWNIDGSYVEATDRQIIVLVELSKIRSKYNSLSRDVLDDKFLTWTYLITKGFQSESEVQAIVDSYPDIEEFAELYGLATNDPKVVRAYKDAKSAVMEYNNRLDYYEMLREEGEAKGRAEGLEEGRAEGEAEGESKATERIAEQLRALNVDESIIEAAIKGGTD